MKNKSMIVLLATSFVLSLLLAACGGGGSGGGNTSSSGGGPADGAKAFFDALYGGNSVDSLICGSNKAAAESYKQAAKTITSSGAKIDTSGLKYDVSNQSGDSADVKVSGKLKTTVSGVSTDTDFPAVTVKMKNESGWKFCG